MGAVKEFERWGDVGYGFAVAMPWTFSTTMGSRSIEVVCDVVEGRAIARSLTISAPTGGLSSNDLRSIPLRDIMAAALWGQLRQRKPGKRWARPARSDAEAQEFVKHLVGYVRGEVTS